ncbi:DUF6795 domain-containing protein [Hahella sp. NBU794]|uniref:DUF6795 domain-containing protein n=2 Tax=unclassified Hahella TaxID=2624107 RepID=UPI003D6F8D87
MLSFSTLAMMSAQDMGVLDMIGKVCLFSEVYGVITYAGEPVSGATVTRWVEWRQKSSDSVRTAQDGSFRLPALYKISLLATLLPIPFRAAQTIYVDVNGTEHLIWSTIKIGSEPNDELAGRPLRFTCELTRKRRYVHLGAASIESNCEWR